MRNQIQILLLAIGFLTRVPVPPDPDFSQAKLDRCARYFPLVGLGIGIFSASITAALACFVPASLAVLLGMAASVRLTGAFHEDGLSDSIDGLGGGWGASKILEIMKDSRLGTYGSCALLFSLAIKWQCLALLFAQDTLSGALALILAHSLSRLAPLWLMGALPYAGDRDKAKSKPLAKSLRLDDLLIAHAIALTPLFLFSLRPALVCLGLAVIVTGWWGKKLQRLIQGYTGDTLGAAQQLVELTIYLALVAQCIST